MDTLEPTFGRSFKVWWSLAWRGFLMTLAIVVPTELALGALLFPFLPDLSSGQLPEAGRLGHALSAMALAWPIVMVATLLAQVLAVRWLLRSGRWSDFRLLLVSDAAETASS